MTDRSFRPTASVPPRPGNRNSNRWPAAVGPLRLALDSTFGPDKIDGIWRPRGSDLHREAAQLINEFPRDRGRIDRIACAQVGWDEQRTFVFTEYGRIPLGTLPAEYRGIALIRLVGGPVIRVQVLRERPVED